MNDEVFNGINIKDIKNSININGTIYDFILEPRNGDIFGCGQDCVKCSINFGDSNSSSYCKICSALYIIATQRISYNPKTNIVIYFKHYFKIRK